MASVRDSENKNVQIFLMFFTNRPLTVYGISMALAVTVYAMVQVRELKLDSTILPLQHSIAINTENAKMALTGFLFLSLSFSVIVQGWLHSF